MQYLGAYKWRISRLVNPLLTAFYLRAETPRLFGAIRALLDDSRLTFRRWGDCSVFPLMRSGEREKGSSNSLRNPLVASARSVVVKSAGLLSVSSLNPAGKILRLSQGPTLATKASSCVGALCLQT